MSQTGLTHILHFSIGPVQGFIGDARRLRDFWAGSFLLSWLAGHAMKAVMDAGGKIDFPLVEGDELFEAIRNPGGAEVYIGSLPNRFRALVPADFDPKVCKDAVREAWRRLAGKVWERFVEPVVREGHGNGTQEIWNRQVEHFWEFLWVMGEDPGDDSDNRWLDQRKNWRTHRQPDEPNDLCTLMGFYQELSGFKRLHDRKKQDDFWEALRKQEYEHEWGGRRSLGFLNLRNGERLCAIALIKRLFPLIARDVDVLGWQPGGGKFSLVNWPSTSYFAAVSWLNALKDRISENELSPLAKVVKELPKSVDIPVRSRKGGSTGREGEIHTILFDLPAGDIFDLDGHLLHEDGIRLWVKEHGAEEYLDKLLAAHAETRKQVGDTHPSEFYAVLLMDGDSIGAKLGNKNSREQVKKGLATFTQRVKKLFAPRNAYDAVLIYAGGDDVLAFMPVDRAIEAAYAVREAYGKAFGNNPEFTLSGAIIFSHFKNPLRHVLELAHTYLDDVAKDGNGRDSLALAVMKPGGIAFDWVSCWDGGKPGLELQRLAQEKMGGERAEFSSGLLYNLRERYAPMFEASGERAAAHGQAIEDVPEDLMKALLVAEYRKQPGRDKLTPEEAEAAIAPLLAVGHPLRRENGECVKVKGYHFGGALLARFLSREGRWHLLSGSGEQKGDARP